jgi:hypothetical protein
MNTSPGSIECGVYAGRSMLSTIKHYTSVATSLPKPGK